MPEVGGNGGSGYQGARRASTLARMRATMASASACSSATLCSLWAVKGAIDWPLLLLSAVLGLTAIASLGLIMGAWTLTMARHFWSVGDAVAGAMYLFSGAIFPLSVLPAWLRWIGFLLPVTYWLEATRRALLGDRVASFDTLAFLSDQALLAILAGFAAVLLVVSAYFYRWALHTSKEKGLLDMESGY